KTPLLQGIVGGEQAFAGLDEQGAQAAAAVLVQAAAVVGLAAFDHAGVESEVADQFLAGGKAVDVANDGNQRVNGDQIEAGQFVEAQDVGLFFNLQGHHSAQALAAFTDRDEAAVHFGEQELLSRTPVLESKESIQRFGPAEAKALGQTQGVVVEEAAQMLLRPGAVFDAALIGRQQLAALPGLRIRLPHFDGQAAQIDA